MVSSVKEKKFFKPQNFFRQNLITYSYVHIKIIHKDIRMPSKSHMWLMYF